MFDIKKYESQLAPVRSHLNFQQKTNKKIFQAKFLLNLDNIFVTLQQDLWQFNLSKVRKYWLSPRRNTISKVPLYVLLKLLSGAIRIFLIGSLTQNICNGKFPDVYQS